MRRHISASLLSVVVAVLAWCSPSLADKPDRVTERAAFVLYRVDSMEHSILTGQPTITPDEAQRYYKTLKVLITSPLVVEAALRGGGFKGLPMPKDEVEHCDWLLDHLRVGMEDGSDVLKISLVHDSAPEDAMRKGVSAVANAFIEEVLLRERIRSRQPRDILAKSYRDLNDEIRRKSEAYYSLLTDAESAELPSVAVKVELMKAQIGRLEEEKLAARRRLFEERLGIRLGEAEGDKADESIEFLKQEYETFIDKLDEQIANLTEQVSEHSQLDPELLARKTEIDGLLQVQSRIAEQIEHWDVELSRPDRVSSLGPASFEEP